MRPEIKALVEQLMPGADDAVLIDFETFYNDECSVKTLGNWAYTHHPLFDCYLVTIFAKDIHFIGHPSEAPWGKIGGRPWLAHNAPFDAACYSWCQEKGAAPDGVSPSYWVDTADIASHFGYPRNLAGASSHLFGIQLNKQVRDEVMKGRYWFQFSTEVQNVILEYADDDAIAWAIYQKLRHEWNKFEFDLSQQNFRASRRGVGIDKDGVEQDIQTLNMMIHVVKQDIPWVDEPDEKGKPYAIGSPRAIKKECDRCGVPVPESTAIKDEDFLEWLDKYGEKVPAMRALGRYRRLTRQIAVYKAMVSRIKPDGRLDAGLLYNGAPATGRWAGTAGINLQNLLKSPFYCDEEFRWLDGPLNAAHKIDIRSRLVPGKGKKFIISDKSQIEPRVLQWGVGNQSFVDLCAAGQSPYEAAARADGAWSSPDSLKKKSKTDTEAAKVYALFKARVISLGYQSGWRTFIDMAFLYVGQEVFEKIFHADVSEEDEDAFLSYLEYLATKFLHKDSRRDLRIWKEGEIDRTTKNVWVNSWLQVTSFRRSNPLLASRDVGIWARFDKEFRASILDENKTYEIPLPSGRSLRYFDISDSGGWKSRRVRGQKSESTYGGLITENWVQAISRDDFGFDILNIEAAGHEVAFHVHDEAIVECDQHVTCEEIVAIMRRCPPWAPGLPLDAEAVEAGHYLK